MPDTSWAIYFRSPSLRALEPVERALSSVSSAPVTRQITPASGDPYNGYGRNGFLRTESEGVSYSATFSQQMSTDNDASPIDLDSVVVSIKTSTEDIPLRLRAWRSLSDALAQVGFRDETWVHSPRRIVDEVESAGDHELAASMRRQITEALLRVLPAYRHVALSQTCPDDFPAVLRAYTRPEEMVSVSLDNNGLDLIPADLARFHNARDLWIGEPKVTAASLRGWSWPRVETLSLRGSSVKRIDAEDLRGFPSLHTLQLTDCPLEALDPALLAACPRLALVYVAGTPLAKDTASLDALAAAWPGVRIERTR